MINFIKKDLERVLNCAAHEIDEDSNLFSQGMDSIWLMHIIEALRRMHINVSFFDMASQPTLRAWDLILTDCSKKQRQFSDKTMEDR